jgi:hypothetical protein
MPNAANSMLTSSRTIGLGARVAATRAPDGSHVLREAGGGGGKIRKRVLGATASATTTALSGSSSSDSASEDEGSGSNDGSDGGAETCPGNPAPSAPSAVGSGCGSNESAAPCAPSPVSRHPPNEFTVARKRSDCSSSSSGSGSEDDDASAAAARDSHLVRGPVVAHPIPRSNEAREARLKLPIVAEEQPLMDLVHHRTCVVLQASAALKMYRKVLQSYTHDCCGAGRDGLRQVNASASISVRAHISLHFEG